MNRLMTSARSSLLDAVVDAVVGGSPLTLVVGGPGTGKTICLRRAVVGAVRAGTPLERIVVLTASRVAAQDMRRAIIAELGTSHLATTITTVHGWCQHLLSDLVNPENMPRLLTAPEQDAQLRELLSATVDELWPSCLRGALGTDGFVAQLRVFLARVRQLGMDPEELADLGRTNGVDEWVSAAGFLAGYLDVLDAEQAIDYAELVHRTRLELTDPAQRGRLGQRYDLVVVDELAEMDPSMINVIADAHRSGLRVLAAADPDTAVFDFRGTDPAAVTSFATRFETPGESVEIFRLTDDLRFTPSIAGCLSAVATRLPVRGPVTRSGSTLIGDTAGVLVPLCTDESAVHEQTARSLHLAHLEEGVDWSQMAVITRSGHANVAAVARRLSEAGIPVQVGGDELALINEPAVRHIIAVLQAGVGLAEGDGIEPTIAESLLLGPIGGLDAVQLRKLCRELRVSAATEGLGHLPGKMLLARELTRGAMEGSERLGRIDTMASILSRLRSDIDAETDVATLMWRVWSATDWKDDLRRRAMASGPDAVRASQDLDAVIALFDLAQKQPDLQGLSGVHRLVMALGSQQIAADTARENDPRRLGVQVMTVHRAKGLEFEMVVVLGAQEGQWPMTSPPAGLLRIDDLMTARDGNELITDQVAIMQTHLARERRSFLLAISRARRRLIIPVVVAGAETGGPSRFVLDLPVEPTPVHPISTPADLDGLVAQLRRALVDESSPVLGAAAGHQLAWLAACIDAKGNQLVPGADPRTWWDVRESTDNPVPIVADDDPVTLTPSAVGRLLRCPRAWFCDRRAGGVMAGTAAINFGNTAHRLVERSALSHTSAETLLQEEPHWLENLVDGPPWRRDAEAKALRDAMTRYDVWAAMPEHSRVIGVEIPFNLTTIVGAEWVRITGTVDRLEADENGALRVVDFKTGRSAPTQADVDAMDQLGIYQFAVAQGAFEQQAPSQRTSAGAEIVHLRLPRGDGPLTRRQEPLAEEETWVVEHLGEAARILRTENFEARANSGCGNCVHRIGCPLWTESR